MKSKHMNIKRILHRIKEEITATIKIAKVTSIKEALITFIAKCDIQIMNRNGYYESKKITKHLLKKHEIMIKYYERTFGEFLKNYNFKKAETKKVGEDLSNVIWVCWWQGLDSAPLLVKKCVQSIKKNAGNHKVIVLTEKNYKNYITIPSWVEEKRNKGIITRTNYSDLLRLSLLAEHGGMWLDATFFCVNANLDKYFKLPLWSIKRPDYGHASVACGNFAGYSLYCNKDNRWIFSVIRDFFLHYWENNNDMIDYLMIDYMIVLAQKHNKKIKKAFEEVPSNNPNCDELYKVLNTAFNQNKWEFIKKDTCMFKLSWKNNFKVETTSGKTFYGKMIDEEI